MTAEKFVDVVKEVAIEGALRSTISNLCTPPGRNPPSYLVEIANWFSTLEDIDRDMVERVARLAVDHATLTFMCIIDGAKAIESGPNKGHLELFYVKGSARLRLNDPNLEPLNDKLR